MQPIGLQVLEDLAANLETCDTRASSFGPSPVNTGEAFDVFCDVRNIGGGDALTFDVTFYASVDTTIDTS